MPTLRMLKEHLKSGVAEVKRLFTTDIKISLKDSTIALRVVAVPGHRVIKLMPEVNGIFHAPIRIICDSTSETDLLCWGDLITKESVKIPSLITVVTIQGISIVDGKETYTDIGTFDLFKGEWIIMPDMDT